VHDIYQKFWITSYIRTVLFICLLVWSLVLPFLILCTWSLPYPIAKVSILQKLSILIPINLFDHIDDVVLAQNGLHPTRHYFVDTTGCRMPKLDIMNDDIAYYLTWNFTVKCGDERPLTRADNEAMWIGLNENELAMYYNITDVDLLTCFYWPFRRLSDMEMKYNNHRVRTFKYGDRVKVGANEQFFKVTCSYDKQQNIYEYSHIFLEDPQKSSNRRMKEKPNVVVLGLDSVSRLNFYRQMPETMKLLNQLGAIELQGYSKVEDNTYPNLIPVLTGLNFTELNHECVPTENSTYDNCPIVWNEFKKRGFKTLFAEDSQYLGLFNYERGGFQQVPVDLYPRNYFLDLENSVADYKRSTAAVCLGQHRTLDVFLDYVKRVTEVYRNESLFAFLWSCASTHDFFESVRSVDSTIRELVLDLKRTDYLNNTVLVLMSDHGLRFGGFRSTYQGMIEERQPFLYMVAPDWYRAMYPRAFENFRINSKRLTTHFDLHETLKDLSNPASLSDDAIVRRTTELNTLTTLPRGISLFLPISETRTCQLAGIDHHWCTCHEQKKLKITSSRALVAAQAIVRHINKLLAKYPQCKKLELNRITDANLNYIKSVDSSCKISDIVMSLETLPGLATFEGTVRVDRNHDTTLMGPVSRTNKYGVQSRCVSDPIAKLYCFC
jgi:Protein of unknown function (DUF229)